MLWTIYTFILRYVQLSESQVQGEKRKRAVELVVLIERRKYCYLLLRNFKSDFFASHFHSLFSLKKVFISVQ
jgi:hypothetical protein